MILFHRLQRQLLLLLFYKLCVPLISEKHENWIRLM